MVTSTPSIVQTKLPANVLPPCRVINLGVCPCRARPCPLQWPRFFVVNLYSNTLHEYRALWMTTLKRSRAGNVSREGVGFKTRKRTSSGGGCWELEDVVNTTAAPVRFRCQTLSGQVEKRRVFITRKGWLWNLGGWVQWVAFLSIARFVHFVMILLFLPILTILSPSPLFFDFLS
jgi:hypothetical protein